MQSLHKRVRFIRSGDPSRPVILPVHRPVTTPFDQHFSANMLVRGVCRRVPVTTPQKWGLTCDYAGARDTPYYVGGAGWQCRSPYETGSVPA